LTDEEMAQCDKESFISKDMDYQVYLDNIRKKKNEIVVDRVIKQYAASKRYILSKDLGIDYLTWKKKGFLYIPCAYYNTEKTGLKNILKNILKRHVLSNEYIKNLYHAIKHTKYNHTPQEVFVGYYNDRKYVFIGNMSRIGYRFSIPFESSEEECRKLNQKQYYSKKNCTYVTTWHEHGKCDIPDNQEYEVRWTQDGYLPPNYSHCDYYFKPDNVKYYCWDILGTQLFKNQGLPFELIPFRKKIYLPEPMFPDTIRNILVVASGSGDWTALKNRSDDDIMVEAIVEIARKFPDINFTYRCHPTWVHPQNVGVNSINRVHDYFLWLNLPNLKLSGNIPPMKTNAGYQYSFSRTSLETDLESADFVIGEHSISMIDAALKRIPFVSVNLTKRRNFFVGINDLGFPSCTSLNDIAKLIRGLNTESFKKTYLEAINNYNKMTDAEK